MEFSYTEIVKSAGHSCPAIAGACMDRTGIPSSYLLLLNIFPGISLLRRVRLSAPIPPGFINTITFCFAVFRTHTQVRPYAHTTPVRDFRFYPLCSKFEYVSIFNCLAFVKTLFLTTVVWGKNMGCARFILSRTLES